MLHPLAQVETLREVATRHAADSERLRTLAPQVVAALRAAGLFGFATPEVLGGGEHGPATQLAVIEALTRIDTSAGWSLMVSSMLTAIAGAYLPPEGVREVFAAGPPPCAGLIVPSGVLRPVTGGYRATGRWAFGSGIRHAEWIVTGAVVQPAAAEPPNGPPAMRTIVVPVHDVVIEDTWHAAGLRGSGSEHYRLEDVFVPDSRSFAFPGAAAERGGVMFDLPIIAQLAPVHAGFALGAARAALDQLVKLAPARIKAWPAVALGQHAAFQMDLGRAEAKLRAARAFACEAIARLEARMKDRCELSLDDWSSARLMATYTTDVAVEVASFAFRSGGASALYEPHALQRVFRDLHAAAQHIAATDDAYEFTGKVLLGTATPHLLTGARAARMAQQSALS